MHISGPTAAYGSILDSQTSQVPKSIEQTSTRSNVKVAGESEGLQNVQTARIEEIRSKIAQGTYAVGSAQIADALIRKFSGTADQPNSKPDPGRSRSWTV